MISKKDKTDLINIIKSIDVKKLDIDGDNKATIGNRKWYQFGVFYALRIVCDIIIALPEPAPRTKKKQEIA